MNTGSSVFLFLLCNLLLACSGGKPEVVVDQALDSATGFSCAGGPDFEVRFLGPETVRLSIADRDNVLQRERTASGARYTGEGIVYWNKGDEAMLETPDGNYRCLRNEHKE
jgi:membrane-bound inhibitor of C-type lysozyme